MTSVWDIRGILYEVSQHCISSAHCTQAIRCVNKYEDQQHCIVCSNGIHRCPFGKVRVSFHFFNILTICNAKNLKKKITDEINGDTALYSRCISAVCRDSADLH
jgi:ferredoxin